MPGGRAELVLGTGRQPSCGTVSPDKNPIEDAVEQALDAFLYAPIGLFFDGPARFPKLVRNGRTQVSNARVMGQFAVQMGRTEVEKRAQELDGPLGEVLRSFGLVPQPPGPAPTPTEGNVETAQTTTAPASGTKKSRAKKRSAPPRKAAARKAGATSKAKRAAKAVAAPSVDSLPIPEYDSLSASQVVSRLRGLDADALESVRRYEAATRGRKTVLSRIQQIQKR